MKSERGSAMIVVVTFTIILTMLVIATSLRLGQLQRELQRIDHLQQKKFQVPKP